MNGRLESIHEQMVTDIETVRSLVVDSVAPPTNIERLVIGETNEVYAVDVLNHPSVVIRISHNPQDGNFDRELWALDKARQADVPVPTVIATGTIAKEKKQYMIQEKIEGTSLDKLLESGSLSLATAQSITEEAGRLLGRLHNIQTQGFGDIDKNGEGHYVTLHDWFSTVLSKKEELTTLLTGAGLVSSEAAALFQLLEANTHSSMPPHLIHDDYAPKHILFGNSGKIVGILDFELAKSGYLGLELPEWELRHRDLLPTAWLLNGYRQARNHTEGFDQPHQRACYAFKSLSLLDYYINSSPDRNLEESCVTGLKNLLHTTPAS